MKPILFVLLAVLVMVAMTSVHAYKHGANQVSHCGGEVDDKDAGNSCGGNGDCDPDDDDEIE
jgi:hypothetical protein